VAEAEYHDSGTRLLWPCKYEPWHRLVERMFQDSSREEDRPQVAEYRTLRCIPYVKHPYCDT